MSLNAFLFQRPFDADGRPLFPAQSELAKAIVAVSSADADEKKRRKDNTRALINQVIHGKRPAPEGLRESITEAVRRQLTKRKIRRPLVDRILSRLTDEFDIGAPPAAATSDNPTGFADLDAEAESASVHYILTVTPAEIKENKKADILKADLVERLGLAPPWDHMRLRGVQYVFNLPDVRTGARLWQSLRKHLAQVWQLSESQAKEKLAVARRERRLVIRTVPMPFCIPPLVVFDPSDNRRGFVLEYQGHSGVHIARLSSDTLAHWYREVYLTLGGIGPTDDNTVAKEPTIDQLEHT